MRFVAGRSRADILLFGALLAGAASLGTVFWMKSAGPAEIERGVILSLTNSPGSEGNLAVIGVRTGNGEERKLSASRRLLAPCKIGDEVELVRRRFVTEVGPRGCLPEG